ncbi:hypothetical protein GCM10009785_34850 [Brooklawnia cerclae]|uniref:Uncharacterized protein n=1 Tax=Brooklawnia cerclae TaxID=349934 RepID=A0ABX0SJ94_9ACTN|nr:hypothetical protein [Brooklawnia cerclae]NIH58474.1 hypothetical protein [Brooklawnia cerclae]
MDLYEATEKAESILGADISAMIGGDDPGLVADRAAIRDSNGYMPDDDGWIPTYDPFLLAAELADLLGLRAQGHDGILSFTSEGSTFRKRAADFFGMAAAIRAKSSKPGGVGIITVDTGMRKAGSLSGDGYVTWDGDLPEWHDWETPWR